MKIKKAKVPLYTASELTVVYTDDFNKYAEKKHFEYDVDTNTFAAGVIELEKGSPTILINPETATPGIIAHECKHALNAIFRYSRIDLDIHNDEPECYLLTWIVDFVHKHLPQL